MSRLKLLAAATLAVELCASCSQSSDKKWEEVQSYGESSIFLDRESIVESGTAKLFWVKIDSNGQSGARFDDAELRKRILIDCKSGNFEISEQALVKDGELVRRIRGSTKGIVPATGYMRSLFRRVCR